MESSSGIHDFSWDDYKERSLYEHDLYLGICKDSSMVEEAIISKIVEEIENESIY